jgi:Ca2+-binding RTX toxin-like protein/uncharacterized protein YjiK
MAINNTSIDLSNYVQVGRYDLPEPSHPGTTTPTGSLLAQEVSSVTYNWDTDTLFVEGDGGTSIVQIDKKGNIIDSMTLGLDPAQPQGTVFYDPEGLAYVGGGKFVLQEERDRQTNLFTYVPNATLYRNRTVDAAGKTLATGGAQTVKLGTTIGNIGTEGIAYDPASNGFILVKEITPEGIFQTTIDFAAGTASNGSPTTVNSTNLFDPALLGVADLADVYALSALPSMAGKDDYNHLLVLSQESGKVLNIDRTGKIYSSLTIDANANGLTTPLTSTTAINVVDQSHEGVTFDKDGYLYITSENGGGDITRPQLWVYAPGATLTTPNKAPTAVVLNNATPSIVQTTSTTTALKVGDIQITDDGKGTNNLTLTGTDASFFEITAGALYLKAGTTLNSTTKASYNVNINADDPTVGSNPDATLAFTLGVTATATPVTPVVPPVTTPATPTTTTLIISEASPWSSGNSPYAADWFELTNTGTTAIDITGWKMDDNSNSFGSAVALRGITSIAAGESVIFIENTLLTVTDVALDDSFKTAWFGTTPPKNLQIGNYGGSGVGLSTGGDAVNIFNAAGTLITGTTFDISTTGQTFDNKAGAASTTFPTPLVSNLSVVDINGAFLSPSGKETGSPGTISPKPISLVGTAGNDTLTGGMGNDTLSGGDGNDLLVGDAGDDLLYAGAGNNVLLGGAGNDTLYSSMTSVDILSGGTGDDTYEIHNTLETIVENSGEGTDTVWTDVSFTLANNVENLYLVGAINGTGNNSNNTIVGYGAGNNVIDGGAGNDNLNGGDGNDTLIGGTGNDTLTGGTGNNNLSGGAGNDTLYSSLASVDTLTGGLGDDIYEIHNTLGTIVENAAEGTDTVWTDTSYTLAANVENLYLVGAINGTGNTGDNTIVGYGAGDNLIDGGAGKDTLSGGDGNDTLLGGAGNDTLNGDAGNDILRGGDGNNILNGGAGNDVLYSSTTGVDTLTGGTGDDVYEIHNTSDQIVENPGEGTDTVWTDASYTLSANIETMYLVGSIYGTGNAGDNTIVGYGAGDNVISGAAGNDTLIGGAGNDLLFGGSGNDTFVFDSSSFLASVISGVDTIGDFTATQDKIQLSKAAFAALSTSAGTLSAYNSTSLTGDFVTVTNANQATFAASAAKILYNSDTGSLFYNADGNVAGFGANGGQFAQLNSGLSLTSNDFKVA